MKLIIIIIIDVRLLNPQWPKGKNREINPAHIEKLRNSLASGVRRLDAETRMKADITRNDFKLFLKHMASQYSASPPAAVVPLHKGKPVVQWTTQVIEEIMRNTVGLKDAQPNDVILFDWPSDIPNLTLDAGQHRKLALESLLVDQAAAAVNPPPPPDDGTSPPPPVKAPTDEDYLWAVDIYASDDFNMEMWMALRSNRREVQNPDADGVFLIRILEVFEAKSLAEQKKLLTSSKLKEWLSQMLGIDLTWVHRILSILKHTGFKRLFKQYCSTPYGALHFNFTTADKMVKLDQIWFRHFEEFFTFERTIFGDLSSKVTGADWSELMTLPVPREHSILRPLSFPTNDDYMNGALNHNLLRLPTAYTDGNLTLPQMKPFTKRGATYQTRRPDFFRTLSDDEYCHLFENLWNHPDLKCPSWQTWTMIAKDVAEPTAKVLKHMTYWFDPEWKYPEAAKKTLQSFSWRNEVQTVILEDSTLTAGGVRGYEPNADTSQVAERLINEVWDEVEEEPLWRDAELTKARFKYRHWAKMVKIALSYAGPALAGKMVVYNDLSKLQENLVNWTAWGHLSAQVNWAQNPMVRGVRVLNTDSMKRSFTSEANVLGALWGYRTLKQIMLETLEKGFPSQVTRSKASVISDEEEWKTAMDHLHQYALILHTNGWNPELDNMIEDLSPYHMNINNHQERTAETRPGFTTAIPKSADLIKGDKGSQILLKKVQAQSLGIPQSSSSTPSQSGPAPSQSGPQNNAVINNNAQSEESDDNDVSDDNHGAGKGGQGAGKAGRGSAKAGQGGSNAGGGDGGEKSKKRARKETKGAASKRRKSN
ncbi:hypothetical protein GB937_010835 [Aspergillus fischeri]|nr:hypothetical protein GB937_010835 [Aspergillus fischeri]